MRLLWIVNVPISIKWLTSGSVNRGRLERSVLIMMFRQKINHLRKTEKWEPVNWSETFKRRTFFSDQVSTISGFSSKSFFLMIVRLDVEEICNYHICSDFFPEQLIFPAMSENQICAKKWPLIGIINAIFGHVFFANQTHCRRRIVCKKHLYFQRSWDEKDCPFCLTVQYLLRK